MPRTFPLHLSSYHVSGPLSFFPHSERVAAAAVATADAAAAAVRSFGTVIDDLNVPAAFINVRLGPKNPTATHCPHPWIGRYDRFLPELLYHSICVLVGTQAESYEKKREKRRRIIVIEFLSSFFRHDTTRYDTTQHDTTRHDTTQSAFPQLTRRARLVFSGVSGCSIARQ